MTKSKKALAFITAVVMLFGIQLSAFAAESSVPESSVAVSSEVETSAPQNATTTQETTTNPSTGQSGVALPLAVALLAVAGAPLLLSKKK